MGVMTMASSPSGTMGPPADRLYPVEPVGVETMTPSADTVHALLPSIRTSISVTPEKESL